MCDADDFDGLLDPALSTYADPGLDFGLEQRILARVHERLAAAQQRRRWMAWGITLPAAACLILLLIVPHSRRPQADRIPQPQAPAEAALVVPAIPAGPVLQTHRAGKPSARVHREVARPAALPAAAPKLAVFPTPSPLSQREEAFVAFVNQASQAQRQALIKAREQSNAPISIAAIRIPPLELPDVGTN